MLLSQRNSDALKKSVTMTCLQFLYMWNKCERVWKCTLFVTNIDIYLFEWKKRKLKVSNVKKKLRNRHNTAKQRQLEFIWCDKNSKITKYFNRLQ